MAFQDVILKLQSKILILFLLIILNMIYIQKIVITPIDITSFFPTNNVLDSRSNIIQNEQRLLFASSKNKELFEELYGLGIIEDIFEIRHHEKTSSIRQ